MKNKKIMILMPILFVVCAIGILLIRESYSAADTARETGDNVYYYIRRNMFSHYFVSNNTTESDGVKTASGTILVKSGNRGNRYEGTPLAVYCAEQGQSNTTAGHTRKTLAQAVKDNNINENAKTKLNAILKYAYPYITLSSMKEALKNSSYGLSGDTYTRLNFDALNVQEAMTAIQASIWNAIQNKSNYYKYGGYLGRISSRQMYYKVMDGEIDWVDCESYAARSWPFSANYGTIYTSEEEQWYSQGRCSPSGQFYQNVFQLRGDGLTEQRINTLVSWYETLNTKVSNGAEPNIAIKSSKYQLNGDKLTLTVTITSEGKNYSINFVDQNGNVLLSNQNVTGNSEGNTFTINNLPLNTTAVKANVTMSSASKNVYYYEGGGQDWIGVSSGDYTDQLNIVNTGTGKITVYKVGDQEVNVEVTNSPTSSGDKCSSYGGCLKDAEFILYSNDKKTVIRKFVTNGEGFTISDLSDGTYYLYEQEPPYGYMTYDYTGENVDEDGYIKIVISNGNTASVVVNNDKTKVCFKKVDSITKEIIDGVKLRVEDAEGSIYEVFTTSKQQGNYCLADGQLESGYYYLVEVETPTGYRVPDKVYKFKVGKFNEDDITVDYKDKDVEKADSSDNVVTVKNKPITVVTKSDFATGGCVTGAHLIIKDKDGRQVDEWTSTCEEDNDSHQVELQAGTYTLVEETAPQGYATSESIEFTVDETGKINKNLDMKDAPIEACFKKVSQNNKDGLAGAEIEIYNEKGELYSKFMSDSVERCFQYMPVGKYRIKETKAPSGYQKLEKDMEVEVKDTDQTQVFEINNEVNAPKTSLDSSQLVIIIASIFMVFGLGLVGYYSYKKKS